MKLSDLHRRIKCILCLGILGSCYVLLHVLELFFPEINATFQPFILKSLKINELHIIYFSLATINVTLLTIFFTRPKKSKTFFINHKNASDV